MAEQKKERQKPDVVNVVKRMIQLPWLAADKASRPPLRCRLIPLRSGQI